MTDLKRVFVHTESRSRDAASHVGDVGKLEKTLHCAILPERAVKDRQEDVNIGE